MSQPKDFTPNLDSGNSSEHRDNEFSSFDKLDHSLFNEHFLLQALHENPGYMQYIIDRNSNLIWANAAAQAETVRLYGRKIVKGNSIFEYSNPNYRDELKRKIDEGFEGKSSRYERQLLGPDGIGIWVTIFIYPLYDQTANVVALSVSGVDITERKLSQNKVREAEQTLTAIFDSLEQSYTLFDINRQISWFNMKAKEEAGFLFGGNIRLGATFRDVVPPAFYDQINSYFDRVYAGETISYQRSYPHLPGVWKQIEMGPAKDKHGEVIGIYVTSKDISELKQALQEVTSNEYKLRAMFEASSDIHTLFSEDNRLIWANREAVKTFPVIFGEELKLGDHIERFVAPQYKSSFFEYIEKAKAGFPVSYERLYNLANGRQMWINVTMRALTYSEDQSKKGITFTVKDITEQKEYEERLTQVNRELVEQNQQLNQFSYIVSHNLRGPIASLMGLTSIMERDLKDKVQSEIIEGYKITVQRFDEIINDLTKILAQTSEADKSKSIISLEEEFYKVMDLQRSTLNSLGAEVQANFAKPQITVVKSFVHSILMNLLSNAIKYRNQDRQLLIQVKSSLQDNKVLIEFTDNGMGIDLDRYHDKLFNFYKRFHTHVEGKGLGLYLVKTQVELMKGKIDIKSKVGEGTTFYIYLPIG